MTCLHGIERTDCQSANDTLIHIGRRRLSCASCDLEAAVDFSLGRYPVEDDRGKRRIARWLRRLGLPDDLLIQGPTFQTGFRCTIIKETISVPCCLGSCAYHIDYPWAANCVLAYLHQQGNESLSSDEIAYLYQFPVDDVRRLLDDSITALRSGAIDQHADDVVSRRFVYYVTDRVCCVCESACEPYHRIASIGAVYCSRECREEKPPRLIELEIEKGLPIGEILDWTFRRYQSLVLAEQALGISRWLTQEACGRYLKEPLDHYFPAMQRQRTILMRLAWSTPAWINSMIEQTRPVTQQIYAQFGPTGVGFKNLRQRLNYLLQNL